MWLAAVVVLALGLGVWWLALTPPVYEARTVVQVEQQGPTLVGGKEVEREDFRTVDVLRTIEQNLGSTELLLRVARNMDLLNDPRLRNELPGVMSRLIALLPRGKAEGPSDASLIRLMNDRVKVGLRRGTRLIDITVTGQDPTLAAQLSQAVVAEYIRLNFEQKVEASRPAHGYMTGELERLKRKLEDSEQKLQAYREEKHAVSLEQTQNIVVESLKDLNKSLSEARNARIKLEADVAAVAQSQDRPGQLLAMAGIGSLPDVVALKQSVAEKEAALASLAERYDARHPTYLQAQSELAKLTLSLTKAAQGAAEHLKTSLNAAQETEQKLESALKAQEKQALELSHISIQYNTLVREVESDRTLYDAVLKQFKETQIVQGVEQGAVRVVEPATVPDRPVSPRKSGALAVALLLGLAGGTLTTLVPAWFSAPLTSVEEAERHLGIPAIAAVPKSRMREGPHRIFLLDQPAAPASEALRSLRAVLTLHGSNGDGRSYIFTSALPGEGKTFCAINFAASLALEGHRTLLIDFDLRVPGVGPQLFGKDGLPGVAEVLQGRATLAEAVRPTKLEHLFVLTAGASITGPSELLASPALEKLLKEASISYDRMVIDSAPVLPVSDTLRLVGHAQHTCLVVRAGATPGRAVARAQQMLTQAAGHPPAGFVLNQVSRNSLGYGSYGSYK
jgi:succinoglycan biosynthesis transport protein ExoP